MLLTVDPSGTGDVTDTHIVWSSRRGTPEIPSPLIVDDLMVILTTAKAVCFFWHTTLLCDSCFHLSCLFPELHEVLIGLHKRLYSLSIRQRGGVGVDAPTTESVL